MREVFDSYLKRRLNIIKALVGVIDKTLAPAVKKLRVDAEIVPYIIQADMRRMKGATYGKRRGSRHFQDDHVGWSGRVDDPVREFELLQAKS
ncbi:hypothetical protein [Dyadobacter sp. 22481]|uniref:hypothetical protein n=1 Tax=Dyadobacter sp. 22481 TaxID=3453926 RepID=UPI003F84E45D